MVGDDPNKTSVFKLLLKSWQRHKRNKSLRQLIVGIASANSENDALGENLVEMAYGAKPDSPEWKLASECLLIMKSSKDSPSYRVKA